MPWLFPPPPRWETPPSTGPQGMAVQRLSSTYVNREQRWTIRTRSDPPPLAGLLSDGVAKQVGETAAHVAARYGQPEVMVQLGKAGANLNLRDKVSMHGNMCAWEYVCMGICVHGNMCAWKYVCMEICVHGNMCAWKYVCMGICVHGVCVHGGMCTWWYVHMVVCAHGGACTRWYVYMGVRVHGGYVCKWWYV